MKKPSIRLFKKQEIAWEYLHDDVTTEICYGGGAGGGKSLLGSLWLASQIASKPGSTWGIGRSELKKIKLSTFLTFKKMLAEVGFDDASYKYDDQKSVMTFVNGCMVVLMDLNENPSDPNFDRLGSTEYTGFFIDEAQEVSGKAKSIVTSRLRNLTGKTYFFSKNKEECKKWIKNNNKGVIYHNKQLDEYQVVQWIQNKPKLLLTLNPGRNFTYTDFYKPRKEGTLLPHRAFVQSLPTDNVFLPPAYIESLKNLNKIDKERLLYGNFEYSDDTSLLFTIDDISDAFERSFPKHGEMYITCDAARQGRDNTVVTIWEGLSLIKVIEIKKASITQQHDLIVDLQKRYDVEINNVIVDEVGVGGGLVDMLGCRGFIANAAPIQPFSAKLLPYRKRNYANLKTQAFFYLQKYLPQIQIYPSCEFKGKIIEEALFIKQVDMDNDNKIKLESKKDTKEKLGRSPDYMDAISFRMWWLIREHHEGTIPDEDKEMKTQKEIDQEELVKFLMEGEKEEEKEFDTSIYD